MTEITVISKPMFYNGEPIIVSQGITANCIDPSLKIGEKCIPQIEATELRKELAHSRQQCEYLRIKLKESQDHCAKQQKEIEFLREFKIYKNNLGELKDV